MDGVEISLLPLDIHHTIKLTKQGIIVPLELLPKQTIKGDVLTAAGGKRCRIIYMENSLKGGHGIVRFAKRGSVDVCVKTSHTTYYNSVSEAIIQWLANYLLSSSAISGAVPCIYDIFQYAGEVRFSMEYIKGVSAFQKVLDSTTPDVTFLQILAQTSLILGFLEETLHLDHRDLKADNIWIRDTPINYALQLGGSKWRIVCPFQVVLLDFGFACIGAGDGNAEINLSDGILPKIDPCPKKGRDLFQFIASLWSIPRILETLGAPLQKEIALLLSYRGKSFSTLLTKSIQTHWIYLIVSDPQFSHEPLHPISLLQFLSIKYCDIGLSTE